MTISITPMLKKVLYLDAAMSGAAGVLMVAGSAVLAPLLEIPAGLLFWAGLALATFGDRIARPRYVALATIASGATAALYLGIICAVDGLLGILLTFAPPLYEPYFLPFDTLRLLPLLRGQWGLTPEVDQQTGGLLMWIPGSLFYLTIIVVMLIRWFDSTSDADLVTVA